MPHTPLPALRLTPGKTHWAAWMATADPAAVETLALCGYDSLVFDLQHGLIDTGETRLGIAAAAAAGAASWVRVTVGGFEQAGQMLDAGAAGVICPMVDDPAIARAFAAAVKYPPLGRRSWGPTRALPLSGMTRARYFGGANAATLAFGMIETEEGVRQLADILRTEGLDGVFVGPNDLAVSVTNGAASEPDHPKAVAAIAHILEISRAAGKPVGIYANSPALGADYARRGFDFVTLGNDLWFLRHGAEAALRAATTE